MDARTRVRQFLARGTADRPPFLVMATEYTARLAQCSPGELLAAGATAAGQPAGPRPAPQPPGAFYLSKDEIPPDQPVNVVRALVRQLSQPYVGLRASRQNRFP